MALLHRCTCQGLEYRLHPISWAPGGFIRTHPSCCRVVTNLFAWRQQANCYLMTSFLPLLLRHWPMTANLDLSSKVSEILFVLWFAARWGSLVPRWVVNWIVVVVDACHGIFTTRCLLHPAVRILLTGCMRTTWCPPGQDDWIVPMQYSHDQSALSIHKNEDHAFGIYSGTSALRNTTSPSECSCLPTSWPIDQQGRFTAVIWDVETKFEFSKVNCYDLMAPSQSSNAYPVTTTLWRRASHSLCPISHP